jgi:diguanylate cyclase (GGDEF)-like protein
MATYDGLTGLLNRGAFEERVSLRLAGGRNNEAFALYFLDLDYFKQVNDTLGHPAGDALLFEVASRLRQAVRDTDILARFGGDEFVILQPGAAEAEDAASLAMRIIQSISEPYVLDDQQVVVGVSVGVAFSPRDGTDISTLFKRADMALYRAKGEGRGTFHFYEEEMDRKAKARRETETDLRAAVKARQFVPWFQPLYDIKLGRVVTCEALVRWPHPKRGLVSPGEFIPIAEDIGLIGAIGEQIIERATVECASWPENIGVAVNLSPLQFARGNIVEAIRTALQNSGLAPHRLEVEITENVLLHDMASAIGTLNILHEMGVKIALDDFGTGYSSLSYLQSLPLNKVKIDRAFLRDIVGNSRSRQLMEGIARLSAELGLRVTVEGVETYEQLDAITATPFVDEIQGFLFCRPVPARDLRDMFGVSVQKLAKAG